MRQFCSAGKWNCVFHKTLPTTEGSRKLVGNGMGRKVLPGLTQASAPMKTLWAAFFITSPRSHLLGHVTSWDMSPSSLLSS